MRAYSFVTAAFLLSLAAAGSTQSYLGLSPEGEQVRKRIWGPEEKRLMQLVKETQGLRQQIGEELEGPTPFWKRLRPLIAAYEAKRAEFRAVGQRLNARLIEELPEQDRLNYLKREYGTPKPPIIVRQPPPPPSQR